jgi:hypothetical protein
MKITLLLTVSLNGLQKQRFLTVVFKANKRNSNGLPK